MAQLVEHILGKDEVISSILITSSTALQMIGCRLLQGFFAAPKAEMGLHGIICILFTTYFALL